MSLFRVFLRVFAYAIAEDGNLKGLWAGGHGEETLTPEQ
jgi:hypothetical protein